MSNWKTVIKGTGLLAAAFVGGFAAQYLMAAGPSAAQAQELEGPTGDGWVMKGTTLDTLNQYGTAPVLVLEGASATFAEAGGGINQRYLNTYLIGTPDPGNQNAYKWYSVASMVRLNSQNDLPESDAVVVRTSPFDLQ